MSDLKYISRVVVLVVMILGVISASPAYSAIRGEVVISDGGNELLRQEVGKNLTNILNLLDKGDLKPASAAFTPSGLESMNDLIKKSPLKNAQPLHTTRLLLLGNGGYEVRDIRVKLKKNPGGNPYQYLVFTLSENGQVEDVRTGLAKQHFQKLQEEGDSLKDFAFRQQIIQFVELFRTAYNRRDIDYLDKVFSDDALIIVGKVVKTKSGAPNMMDACKRKPEEIKFIRRSKSEYLGKLKETFEKNDMLNIIFDKVEVIRHQSFHKIYGVTLKQKWRSSTYSDVGWVFLMIDFNNPDEPLIHVRSWQPKPFGDGSTLGLFDFELIGG